MNYFALPGIINQVAPTEEQLIEDAIEAAVKIAGVDNRDALFAKNRIVPLPTCRQMLAYFVKNNTKKKLWIIEEMLKQDHSTICHNAKKVETMLSIKDELYCNFWHQFQKQINIINNNRLLKQFQTIKNF